MIMDEEVVDEIKELFYYEEYIVGSIMMIEFVVICEN